ncbi:glycerophosphodiester phosphodiesterase GDPDL3 isoform X1 [Zea mays]|uniref:glycerophosphodiester phosphodiesterase n=2 Tax=Zea mays TaxID=4577 RepID=A0A1D6KIK0_MAIZE|nr:glycerophosphodiester phosphodiesterase GDPDL3 isoform X1 [Zea mays]XP_008645857.1 glycerophosphodiester phosphodiesterase GDPDL3 isoform X1 [Zea mays]XP_035815600.1 glycerophosphodiester phosphodiesterase GDPDL3 isoform X1 [Zea mays]ONM02816.1 Glycerophosphodiester phosphodiesterase GDPDL3 [Zea mays]ONM02817.1 Glycerophosphodiester phosphodiesterase GDPDL3 [Zea mays]|eukprot:XP_008645847.1 glycerophosphodiester phosphodiesterase GDPDL3 isoform X1 [Zea mays]
MGRSRRHEGGGGGERRGAGAGGVAAAAFAALLLGCVVMALVGGAAAQGPRLPSDYKTLSGAAPLVVARGGFSGAFPDSSEGAYSFGASASAPGTAMWCDVQLTKDGVGLCLRDVNMKNCTTVDQTYPGRKRTYVIDGVHKTGWFVPDFTSAELLQSVYLTQAIWSRTERMDGIYPIVTVPDVQSIVNTSPIWLNVQHPIFYKQRDLDMSSYIHSIRKLVRMDYISSPEIGFLRNISARVRRRTKLVFSFLDKKLLDHSVNQTYGSLARNLTFVRSVASGILVPKDYIWPVTADNYLLPSTSIVTEAHEAGLEIYASGFVNDKAVPFNYSYDPLAEYLNFVGDGGFSVDGVLSDYPITASEAIGCFANLNSSKTDHVTGKPLVISHNGASGDYPDCTDLAYHSAVDDGADVIDCPVQVTSDGVLMCMSSINLLDTTNVQRTPFATPSLVPSILINVILSSLINLSSLPQNAAFIAKSLGIDMVDSVTAALSAAGFSNQTTKEVLIRSTDSAVLVKLKQQKTRCKLVYTLPLGIGDASKPSLKDIKAFAEAVVVDRTSVFALSYDFIMGQNRIVRDLQAAGLAVYAQVFRNEYVAHPFDFLGDPTVEINYYVQTFNLSGMITDFPKTVRRYKENTCTALGKDMPKYMRPVEAGSLADFLRSFQTQPPSVAPMPALNSSSVEEPPLPTAAPRNVPPGGGAPADAAGTAGGAAPSDASSGGAPPSDARHTATGSSGMLLVVLVSAALLI